MDEISLRPASGDDEDFALRVTEACMRGHAERAFGRWNGRSDLDPAHDEVIRFETTSPPTPPRLPDTSAPAGR